MGNLLVIPWTKTRKKKKSRNKLETCCDSASGHRRRHQCQCAHKQADIISFSKMTCSCCQISPIIPIFVCFLFVASSSVRPALSSSSSLSSSASNQTLRSGQEFEKLEKIRAHIKKINKPAVKTIQSPDGDLIDCVLIHQQPAFDHPLLQGHKPLDRPKKPKGCNSSGLASEESYQLWSSSGGSCPVGTVPIRRTTEEDVLRASSVRRFGRKAPRRVVRRDSKSNGHEHAVGYVKGDQYYGGKASINVWAPRVANAEEFSLSQIWLTAGSFGPDLNTIEAGWQISPDLYGDNNPRLFTYWTADGYVNTGCYNLLCSGFVQTSNRIAIGGAISPVSAYGRSQFDITLMVWKDPKHGNWWLAYGSNVLVGYWPSFLFRHLGDKASMVQFGGEVVNTKPRGSHTSTQMGSGHFPGEGFGKASYFRNLQVVDWDNNLIPPRNLQLLADHSDCYGVLDGTNTPAWGKYFYYGGPGRNVRCP